MSTARRQFTPAFKTRAAAALLNRGNKSAEQIAEKFGVRTNLLYKWAAGQNGAPAPTETATPAKATGVRAEVEALRKQVDALSRRVARLAK